MTSTATATLTSSTGSALPDDAGAIEAAAAAFRERVRAEVLRRHFEGTWCLPGTRDVLRDLDLAPVSMSYAGSATIRVRITRVDGAADHYDAHDRVVQALSATSADDRVTFEVDQVDAYDLAERPVREG